MYLQIKVTFIDRGHYIYNAFVTDTYWVFPPRNQISENNVQFNIDIRNMKKVKRL